MYKSASFATCHSKLRRALARALARLCMRDQNQCICSVSANVVRSSLISILFQISAIQLPFDSTVDNKSDCGETEERKKEEKKSPREECESIWRVRLIEGKIKSEPKI